MLWVPVKLHDDEANNGEYLILVALAIRKRELGADSEPTKLVRKRLEELLCSR